MSGFTRWSFAALLATLGAPWTAPPAFFTPRPSWSLAERHEDERVLARRLIVYSTPSVDDVPPTVDA